MDSDNKYLWGCAAIAAELGRSKRATFHMLEKKLVPARKVGGQWVAEREGLARFLRGEE